MEVFISIIAIIISFVALIRTRSFNSKILMLEEENTKLSRLQRKILEREEEKRYLCEVSAYWYKGENNTDRIAIINNGAVTAYNINFEFKPKNGKSSPEVKNVMEEIFPINKLEPEDERYFIIGVSMSTGSEWPANISWENKNGKYIENNIILGRK